MGCFTACTTETKVSPSLSSIDSIQVAKSVLDSIPSIPQQLDMCSDNYVFGESLSEKQCKQIELDFSVKCVLDDFGHFQVSSNTNMTIKVCLQICTTNGFFYAGLNKYYCFKVLKLI